MTHGRVDEYRILCMNPKCGLSVLGGESNPQYWTTELVAVEEAEKMAKQFPGHTYIVVKPISMSLTATCTTTYFK